MELISDKISLAGTSPARIHGNVDKKQQIKIDLGLLLIQMHYGFVNIWLLGFYKFVRKLRSEPLNSYFLIQTYPNLFLTHSASNFFLGMSLKTYCKDHLIALPGKKNQE